MRARPPPKLSLSIALFALMGDMLLIAVTQSDRLPGTADGRAWLALMTQPSVLWLHVVWMAALVTLVRPVREALGAVPIVGLLALLMVVLGPLGSVLGAAIAAVDAAAPARWKAWAQLPLDAEVQAVANERTAMGKHDAETLPLCDIFRHGTLAQRRRAVALMAGNWKPEFAAALHMALSDEHNAIRVQAGMALLALEDEFGRLDQQFSRRISGSHPAMDLVGEPSHIEHARLHDRTAWSGLLDRERTRSSRVIAIQSYREHLLEHPSDADAIAAVGRLFVRTDQHQLVAGWFGDLVRQGPVSDSIVMWLAEALFRGARYAELQALLREHGARLEQSLPIDSPMRISLQFWMNASRADGGGDVTSGS